jgi:hypothetical protein
MKFLIELSLVLGAINISCFGLYRIIRDKKYYLILGVSFVAVNVLLIWLPIYVFESINSNEVLRWSFFGIGVYCLLMFMQLKRRER